MSRSVNPRPQFFDDAGDPLVAGKMFYFESGTDTPKETYADVNLLIPNTHPVDLTGDGRLPNVFFQGTTRQKLTDADDVQIWDVDNVSDDDIDVAFSNWSPLIIYNITDIVQGNDGRFYISFTNGNEGNDPTTTPSEWQEIQFINVWNTNVTYQIGTTVKASDNLFYVSQTADNLGNDPVGDAVNWGAPFDGVATVTGGTGITVTGTAGDPIINADNNGIVTSITGGTGITVSGTAAVPIITADNLGTVTSVATAGLATGGPITATGTVTVTKASSAEVATGTEDTKAVTPLAMADALLGVNNLSDVADTQTSLNNLIAGNFVNRIVGADIVSASPLVLGADGDHFSVTGNVGFSVITVAADRHFTCTFTGTPTITVGAGITLNNAGGNYTVAVGDTLVGQSTAANTVTGYIIKADGTALVVVSTGITQLTTQATTSGSSITFTIPAGANRVKILPLNVSDNANASPVRVRLGDIGGIEATGYAGNVETAATRESFSTDFHLSMTNQGDAASGFSGVVDLERIEGTNTWVCSGTTGSSPGSNPSYFGGDKTLTAELTTVEVFTAATFDAGSVSATWE